MPNFDGCAFVSLANLLSPLTIISPGYAGDARIKLWHDCAITNDYVLLLVIYNCRNRLISPLKRPRSPFKRPYNLARNPAPIEVAFLRLDLFIIYETSLHLAWIKSHMIGQRFVWVRRMLIKPRDIGCRFVTNGDAVV
jgi:hypothetical protein